MWSLHGTVHARFRRRRMRRRYEKPHAASRRTAHVRYGTAPTIAPPAEPSPLPAGGSVPPVCTIHNPRRAAAMRFFFRDYSQEITICLFSEPR